MRTRANYLAHIEAVQRRSDAAVARHIADRSPITSSLPDADEETSFDQRAADAVARFGGSWTFIGLFALVLVAWVTVNSVLLTGRGHTAFDPYPYILLNLFLSMLASVQAPLILMSQNRQGEIDRINARNDYEVNLKAELEILSLHEKHDRLTHQMLNMQREQLQLLNQLCARSQAEGEKVQG